MFKHLLRFLPSLISVLLLISSLWVIHQELQQYTSYDIWRQLAAIPRLQLGLAIVLTLLNCWVFTGYDTLAAQYVQHPLSYRQTALAAVTSIPISNSVGLSLLSGSAIRYRLYAAWGVPPIKITQMLAFCNLSFWLGLLTIGGLLFLGQPVEIPAKLHLPFASSQPIGAIFLTVITVYLLWNLLSPKTLRFGQMTISHLPMRLCFGQIVVSSLDWTLAAAVLYALLPDNTAIAYAAYFGIYLLAQFAGVVSNIPGGLGIFETVMLLLLVPAVPSSALFGALIAYRVIYYLLPLTGAVLLLLLYEVHSHRKKH
jgi:uncharacterized membrane protein YbhN (UPF0104 family)